MATNNHNNGEPLGDIEMFILAQLDYYAEWYKSLYTGETND